MFRVPLFVLIFGAALGCQTAPDARVPAGGGRGEWVPRDEWAAAKNKDADIFAEIGARISKYAVRVDSRDVFQTIQGTWNCTALRPGRTSNVFLPVYRGILKSSGGGEITLRYVSQDAASTKAWKPVCREIDASARQTWVITQPVEDLRPGDLIQTEDELPGPIRSALHCRPERVPAREAETRRLIGVCRS